MNTTDADGSRWGVQRFKRGDLPSIRRAVASVDKELIEAADQRFNIDTFRNGRTNELRAKRLVEHVTEFPDGDEGLLDLLNVVFFEDSTESERVNNPRFVAMVDEVLAPRGVYFDEDEGFNFDFGKPLGNDPERLAHQYMGTPVRATREPASPSPRGQGATSKKTGSKEVFVVQGRDGRPVHELERFLSFLNLKVMRWGDARKRVGKAQPTTFEIVQAGLMHAGAVIVVLSPDDQAALRAELSPEVEQGRPVLSDAGFQPRQNVLLEAGLAYGMAPEKVIFVQSATGMRAISDIDGFHFIRMDGSWTQRENLVHSLRAAGMSPEPTYSNLTDRLAGPFAVEPY